MPEQRKNSYLEGKNVTKHFGGVAALSEVTFNVSKGELLCIIGPNGSGKTTLLNMITSVSALRGGEIWFNGGKLHGLAFKIFKYSMSYL